MPSEKLTQASMKTLMSDDPRGTRYTDTETKGFGVTVYPDGRKVFLLRYGSRKRRRFVTIGAWSQKLTVDVARKKALDIIAAWRIHDIDEAAKRKRRAAVPTFSEWVEDYIQERKRVKRSWAREHTYLKDAAAIFGAVPIDELTPKDIREARRRIAERGEVVGNRWLSAVRACLKAAIGEVRGLEHNPAANVVLSKEHPNARAALDPEQIARIVAAADADPDPWVRGAVLLAIGTGARKGEILSARWSDIDLEVGEWRLPQTKSGREQVVHLAPPVVELLEALPRIVGVEWVFPTARGKRRRFIDREWYAIRTRASVPGATFHSLRKTFADRVNRDADLQTASALLRHASLNVTAQHYAGAVDERLKATLEKVVGGVIPFPGARRAS